MHGPAAAAGSYGRARDSLMTFAVIFRATSRSANQSRKRFRRVNGTTGAGLVQVYALD